MRTVHVTPCRRERRRTAALPAGIFFVSLVLSGCFDGEGTSNDVQDGGVSPPPPTGGVDGGANRAPVIGGTPITVAKTSLAYYFQPSASDPDGDRLTFEIVGKPGWAQFNASNGALYGTPGDGATGSYPGIQILVSDGKAQSALPAFTITVSPPVIGSATLSWQAPSENEDGTALTDLAGYVVRYSKNPGNLDQTMSINSPGATSVVIDNLIEGTWFFTLSSVNSSGVESRPTGAVSKIIG